MSVKIRFGTCERIYALGNDSFDLLSELYKEDLINGGELLKGRYDSSVKLFPVRVKDYFSGESVIVLVLRDLRVDFDNILPMTLTQANPMALRNLMNYQFGKNGTMRITMRGVYSIKSSLFGGEENGDICTLYYTDKTGLVSSCFCGAKILNLSGSDSEQSIKADFIECDTPSLTFKRDNDNRLVKLDSLFDSLLLKVEDPLLLRVDLELMVLASLSAPLVQMLSLPSVVIGVSGRLASSLTRFVTSFWSNPDALELIDNTRLGKCISDYNGLTVSISEEKYSSDVADVLSRGYSKSKLDGVHLTAFHFDDGVIERHKNGELYLNVDLESDSIDEDDFQDDDFRVMQLKSTIDELVRDEYGCIGCEFLREVFFKRDLKRIAQRCVEDFDFFGFLKDSAVNELSVNFSSKMLNFIWDELIFDCGKSDVDSFKFKKNCLIVINCYARYLILNYFMTESNLPLNYKTSVLNFANRYSVLGMVSILWFNGDDFKRTCRHVGELIVSGFITIDNNLKSDVYTCEALSLFANDKYEDIYLLFIKSLRSVSVLHSQEDFIFDKTIVRNGKTYYKFTRNELLSYMSVIGLDESKMKKILNHWAKSGLLYKNGSSGIQASIKEENLVKKYYLVLSPNSSDDSDGGLHE